VDLNTDREGPRYRADSISDDDRRAIERANVVPGGRAMTPEQRQRVEQFVARLVMTATERAESFADAFHRATGHFMPGCSVPPAVGAVDEDERRRAWEAWTKSERPANIAALRACLAALDAAQQKFETERLRLVACSVATTINTPATIAHRIKPDNPYYSVAYADVCAAVDREIAERQRADAAEQERDTASAALDEVTAPDASTWVERLRGLAREIGTVSSVAQRVADYDRQMVTRLDEWSSTVYHVADKLAALTAPPAPHASPPEPDSAEWWRQVSQGLAAEIAKLKAERPRCEWRAYPNGPQCTRTAGHGLPHETRSDGTCGMRHETGARCTLPDGHTENHRGEFAGGVAQWPKETSR